MCIFSKYLENIAVLWTVHLFGSNMLGDQMQTRAHYVRNIKFIIIIVFKLSF